MTGLGTWGRTGLESRGCIVHRSSFEPGDTGRPIFTDTATLRRDSRLRAERSRQ